MSARLTAMLLSLIVLGPVLSACGGSSRSSSTAAHPPAGKAAAPAGGEPTPTSWAELAAERAAAGRAASFVLAEADNSIPTFGSEAGAAERRAAEGTLKAYLDARAGKDWAASCRLLAASTRHGLEEVAKGKARCPEVLAAFAKGADLADPLTGALLSLRIEGDNAFALFYGPGHRRYIVPMNREGGTWRPTQTAAIAYPPALTTKRSR